MPNRKKPVRRGRKKRHQTTGNIHVPTIPPTLNYNPYQNITLSYTTKIVATKNLEFNIAYLVTELNAQTGIAGEFYFEIFWIKAWEITGKRFHSEIYNLYETNIEGYSIPCVARLEAYPTPLTYARLGWKYTSGKDTTLLTTSGAHANLLFKILTRAEEAAEVLVYIHLKFAPVGGKPFSSMEDYWSSTKNETANTEEEEKEFMVVDVNERQSSQ